MGYILKQAIFNFLCKRNLDYKFIRYESIPRNIYLANSLFKVIISIASYKFIITYIYLSFFRTRRKKLYYLLHLKYKSILVGDCILSQYFRNVNYPIYPNNIHLFFFYFIFFVRINIIDHKITRIKKKFNGDILYFSFETTGYQEIVRRICNKYAIDSIWYSIYDSAFIRWKNKDGVYLRKGIPFREKIYSNLSEKEINIGKKSINQLVNRKKKYIYLRTTDIDINEKISFPRQTSKSTIVLFLSSISDAQYMYGIGPSPTLADFDNDVIERSLEMGFNVVVKPHPGMLKTKEFSSKDRCYFDQLKNKWKPITVSKNLQQSSVNNKLFFCSHALSVMELHSVFPDYLCISQHGSVIAEAACKNLFTCAAGSSKYFHLDTFVRILHSFKDYSNIIKEWQNFKTYTKEQRISLYKFSFVNHVSCQRLFPSEVFGNLFPADIDSSYADQWISDFTSSKQNLALLQDKANSYVLKNPNTLKVY